MTDWSKHFYYDETSPTCLRWAREVKRGRGHKILFKAVGDVAGSYGIGYSSVSVNGQLFKTHRVVWEIFNGEIVGDFDVDHVDGNIKNNRIDNLRLVKTVFNTRNSRMRRDNKTGVSGVSRTVKGGSNAYWRVVWYTVDCVRREKYFSVSKMGEEVARTLAVDFAMLQKELLNQSGAGYTERHGKE